MQNDVMQEYGEVKLCKLGKLNAQKLMCCMDFCVTTLLDHFSSKKIQ